MAQNIKSLLYSFLSTQNSWKCQLLEAWPSIIGDLKQHVQLEKIYDDTLVLAVRDSSWLHELYMLSHVLLKTINQKLDQPRIKQLRFKNMRTSHRNNKKMYYQPRRTCNIVNLSVKEKCALESINDIQLREALKKFLIRCYQEQE